jgi:hypothetical protein
MFLLGSTLSCDKESLQPTIKGSNVVTSTFGSPTGLEIWIDSTIQQVKLYRVRKASGASRMRILVEMPDSVHFSLFLTPFEIGSHQLETGNISDEVVKFSRTHCDLQQEISNTQSFLYEVDTILGFRNSVEITQVDTIKRTVTGRFNCHMKKVSYVGKPSPEKIQLWGRINSTYRD